MFNETLGDTNYEPIPVECLLPLTASGISPSTFQATVPSYCASYITNLASRLKCCSRILNDILAMLQLQTGQDGVYTQSCVDYVAKVRITVAGMKYAETEQTLGHAAVVQMATDEVAHLFPAVIRSEFLRNIKVSGPSAQTRSDIEETVVELEAKYPYLVIIHETQYQPMSDTTAETELSEMSGDMDDQQLECGCLVISLLNPVQRNDRLTY